MDACCPFSVIQCAGLSGSILDPREKQTVRKGLNSQYVEDEGEESAGDDYVDDSRHYRFGRSLADCRRTIAALEPPQASRDRDNDAVNGGLEYAAEDVGKGDRGLRFAKIRAE